MKVDVLAVATRIQVPQKFQAMSKEQFKAFQEATQKDAGLQEKLRSASGADDVVAIARAAGFLISAEELHRAQAELSDEELAGLSGGGTL